jgi:hypothetical protein
VGGPSREGSYCSTKPAGKKKGKAKAKGKGKGKPLGRWRRAMATTGRPAAGV